jgi:hypothetical protein
MAGPIKVYKGRTVKLPVQLPYDVSQDTITSQIRKSKSRASLLIATWQVSFRSDGRDGKLDFILDDSVTSLITAQYGYMDILRVSGGEPYSVLDDPIMVEFKSVVTT